MWSPPITLLILLGALVGAAAFRLRGDALWSRLTGRGAGTARIMWAVAMAAVAIGAGHGVLSVALIGAGLFVGATPPWWRSLTLGARPEDGPAAGQYLRHALRGLIWTAPAGLLLMAAAAVDAWMAGSPAWAAPLNSGGLWLLAAGALCVPAYQAGKWISPPDRGRVPGMTEWGEGLFGAGIGAAVVVSA